MITSMSGKRNRVQNIIAGQVLKRPFRSPLRTGKLATATTSTATVKVQHEEDGIVERTCGNELNCEDEGGDTIKLKVEMESKNKRDDQGSRNNAITKCPETNLRLTKKCVNGRKADSLVMKLAVKHRELGQKRHGLVEDVETMSSALKLMKRNYRTQRNGEQVNDQSCVYKVGGVEGDEALDELIEKWRTAAQAAAEALWSTAREKVHRMGGVAVWRQKELSRRVWLQDMKKMWAQEEIEAEKKRKMAELEDSDDQDEDSIQDEDGSQRSRKRSKKLHDDNEINYNSAYEPAVNNADKDIKVNSEDEDQIAPKESYLYGADDDVSLIPSYAKF